MLGRRVFLGVLAGGLLLGGKKPKPPRPTPTTTTTVLPVAGSWNSAQVAVIRWDATLRG